jgi:lipid intermediate transporter
MTIVCVECGHLSNYSLKTYGDISSGHVRLAVCKACKKDVDKYLEYESLLLVLDLMLHRTAAFRHLLINRLSEVSPAISHLPASLSSIQTKISSSSTVSQSTNT